MDKVAKYRHSLFEVKANCTIARTEAKRRGRAERDAFIKMLSGSSVPKSLGRKTATTAQSLEPAAVSDKDGDAPSLGAELEMI